MEPLPYVPKDRPDAALLIRWDDYGGEPRTEEAIWDPMICTTKLHLYDVASDGQSAACLCGNGDPITVPEAPEWAEAASDMILRQKIEDTLNNLTPRERDVLKMRFGLDDGYSRTLEEVGRHFKVTRERIRQIEAKALKKLRHPRRSRKLRDYLE